MTNAPESRKTHVIRILGTNKAGDILPDIWADVERIDEAKTVHETAETSFQGTVKRLKWSDDPDKDDYNPDGTPSRKLTIVKVCSPDEPDQSDPEQWIPIPVIDKRRSQIGDQGKVEKFINDRKTSARIVKQRRILHYDTNIDDKAQAAFDADPARKVFVVTGDQYTRDDSTKDDSQFLEHEVITFWKSQETEDTGSGQGGDQGKQVKLLNQYLIDESDPAKLEIVGTDGFNPPWRLDPYQNIVNVQFSGQLLLVWFSGGARLASGDVPVTGYYRTLTGKERSGSFKSTLSEPPNFTDSNISFKPTDAQKATADGLAPIQSRFMSGGTLFVSSTPVASTMTTISAINKSGTITRTINATPYTGIVPPNFNTDPTVPGPATDNNVPFVSQTNVVVVGGIVYLMFEIHGRSIPDPADEPHNFALLSAVGYVGIDKNDTVVKSDLISGPDLGSGGYTDDETVVHTFTAAGAGSLLLGRFSN